MDPALGVVLLQSGGLTLTAAVVIAWLIWTDRPPGPPAH